MNGQLFHESLTPTEIVENNDQKTTNNRESNPDHLTDHTQVDADPLHEVPMGGTVAAVGPLNRSSVEPIPMYQTPNQEIPMGGTIAAVSPMNGQMVDEIPVGQTGKAVNLLDGAVVREDQLGDTVPYNSNLNPTRHQVPMNETNPVKTPAVPTSDTSSALLNREESDHFRTRWNSIQAKFVDDPRTAVQEADTLVNEVIEQITKMFADNHSSLESQWKQGSEVSTENLRTSFQHYRSFFNRLVV